MTAQYPFTLNRTGSRRHRIALIDGPNMSSLGARSKQVYGMIGSLDDLKAFVTSAGSDIGVAVETFSSNHMGDILEYIHGSADRIDGYIINPAGLTTMGEAVRHALEDTTKPAVEVHFANISGAPGTPRGLASGKLISTFTHTATGLCMGLRQYSYIAALVGLVMALDDKGFLGTELADLETA